MRPPMKFGLFEILQKLPPGTPERSVERPPKHTDAYSHGYLEEIVGQTTQPGLRAVVVFCAYDANINSSLRWEFLRC